jgi:AraC-like DNA-binding protein
VPDGEGAVPTSCWHTFQRSAATTESLVAVLPGPVSGDDIEALASLQRRLPYHPLVLAVDRDPENLRRLSPLRVAEMIWTEEVDRQLWPTLRRARTGAALRRLARQLEDADWIPARLRQALAAACRATSPVRTMPELAALVGRDRRTIWRLWQSTFGPESPLRLQDFLDWILLVHAAAHRSTGLRWSTVAQELRVHEHTIARIARRLAGINLRQVGDGGPGEVIRRFELRAVRPLLDRGADRARSAAYAGAEA